PSSPRMFCSFFVVAVMFGNSRISFCADGLFGQCQAPHQEPVQYQVSVPVLHKLQEVLKDLMVQGESLNTRDQGPEDQADPKMMQQYVDYMVLNPSRSSVHMQTPLLDPYTYHKERSLNSLDDNRALPFHPSSYRSRSRGSPLDRDRQLLQDLVSFYLTSPSSSSSSSSSPVQSLPRHRGAVAAAALDFPLDYGEDYVSQVAQQEPAEKKAQDEYDALSELDGEREKKTSHYFFCPSCLFFVYSFFKYRVCLSAHFLLFFFLFQGNVCKFLQFFSFLIHSLGYPYSCSIPPTLYPRIGLSTNSFIRISVVGPAITFRIRPNAKNLTAADVADKAVAEKNFLESETGLKVLQSGVGEVSNNGKSLPLATRVQPRSRWVFAMLVAMACIGGILVAAMTITCLRHHAHRLAAKKLGLGPEGGSFSHQEYQDLCRQHMASKGAFGRLEAAALGTDSRVSSVSSQFSDGAQPSPSSHSSTPSWCEEPAQANMDISTGHMILAYMEDHLRNKDRLLKEWEALCSYQAEPSAVSVAQSDTNVKKNRCPDSVPCEFLNNFTPISIKYPVKVALLKHGMVWENGCTVIVMMTALVEDGEKQCDRYWPDEGSSLYHIYEVNLVSEHIWCNDFLVRSFYLKNVQTQETRTLTQFHFLSWPAQGIPTSTRPLLDFLKSHSNKVFLCMGGGLTFLFMVL
uniref:Protein tyrosine phosphatase receptor type Nb n=1 Tax=Neolamprologus brichardi TaxID=32507 RepID=A0A3Q4HTL1_NEOBR